MNIQKTYKKIPKVARGEAGQKINSSPALDNPATGVNGGEEKERPSVSFVYDQLTKRWLISGDPRKLCRYVDIDTQICMDKGSITAGHTCLTPAPEVMNCWRPREGV